jgi:hypothetical protein
LQLQRHRLPWHLEPLLLLALLLLLLLLPDLGH